MYVYPDTPSAYPSSNFNPSSFSGNTTLNHIFNDFGVVNYKQSFPGADHPTLPNAYDIHLSGDIFEFKNRLESSGLFSRVEIAPYYATQNCSQCQPITVNDPNADWALNAIEAECAWGITEGDPNVIVAIVDTEFDETHPDLVGKFVNDVTTEMNPCIHGTRVASLVASNSDNGIFMAGIGKNIRLAGYISPSGAIPNGCSINPTDRVWNAFIDGRRIINCSYGPGLGLDPPYNNCLTINECVQHITENGTLIVTAAGNWATANHHSGYADIPGVINVSSTYEGNDGNQYYADWVGEDGDGHARNQWVDLCAPGVDVTRLEPNNGIGIKSGTSISAPIVSGTAGLMLSVNDCLTPASLEEYIKETTDDFRTQEDYPGLLGTGSLNAYKAVKAATGEFHPIGEVDLFDEPEHRIWEAEHYLSCDLLIKSGSSLTINNTIVHVDDDVRIIVEPGARLTINNSTITNTSEYCLGNNGRWEGILVQGNRFLPQTLDNQGTVICKNNSKIKHANKAFDLQYGAKLIATDSDFENNIRTVNCQLYENYINNTKFENCTFTVNDELINYVPYEFYSHVYLNNVRGVRFEGCTFSNDRSSDNSISEYGRGIAAFNASFRVQSSCPFAIPQGGDCAGEVGISVFENLLYGIDASASNSLRTFSVYDAEFNQNKIGIYFKAVDEPIINNNVFNVGRASNHPAASRIYEGVYGTESTRYAITYNEFTKDNQAGGGDFWIGNRINDSNADSDTADDYNEIMCNEHNGLDYASLSNGDNRASITNWKGLVYRTNWYDGNKFGIAAPEQNVPQAGFGAIQGESGASIGNLFDNNIQFDVFNATNTDVLYWYGPGNPKEFPAKRLGIDIDDSDNSTECKYPRTPKECDEEDEITNPDGDIRNPRTPRDPENGKEVYDCVKSTLDDIRGEIVQTENESIRHNLEIEAGQLEGQLSIIASTVVHYLLTNYESDGINYPLLREWLEKRGGIKAHFAVAESYIDEGNNTQALAYLNSKIQDSAGNERQNYRRFYQLKQIEIAANGNLEGLTSSQINQVYRLAENRTGRSSAQAQAILEKLYEYDYFVEAVLPEWNEVLDFSQDQLRLNETNRLFSISPNPAKDELNLQFQLEGYGTGQINFYNVNGTLVESYNVAPVNGQMQLDISSFKSGLYFYQLWCDNTICENGKLFVLD